MKLLVVLKLIAGVALAANALVQLFSNETLWFMQNVNLIFHEAGHMIFGVGGNFIGLLGGSLLEILVPIVVTVHFLMQRYFMSAAFGAWWMTTAFLSVSIYAADAQEQLLPLVGGDAALHDWYHILSQLHLLKYDDLVGYVFWYGAAFSTALLIFFVSRDKDIQELAARHAIL